MKECVIGIDLGGTNLQLALVDEDGNILAEENFLTDSSGGYTGVENEIINGVHSLIAKTNIHPKAIGIGIPGQVNLEGQVIFVPNLKWHNVPLKENLEKKLKIPVNITNDVRASTWGEWHYGSGKGYNDLVCMFVGTGVGGGIISNGELISGASNTAGEIGHMIVKMNGSLCSCGQKGCLEAYAGGWAIAKHAQEYIKKDPSEGKSLLELADGQWENITAKTVAQAFYKNNPIAIKVIENAGKALIAGSISIIHAINPSLLILGGGIIQGMPFLIDWIREGIQKNALEAAKKSLKILPAKLIDRHAGVIGAAAWAWHKAKS